MYVVSIYLSVCLSVFLSVCLSIYHLSIYLSIYLSTNQSINQSTNQSINQIHQSNQSINQTINQSINQIISLRGIVDGWIISFWGGHDWHIDMIETQKGQPGYNSNSVTSGSMALDLPEGEITTDVTWECVFFLIGRSNTPLENWQSLP